jgi:hypothetical protein
MKAKLDVKTTGIKGGNPNYKETGKVVLFPDGSNKEYISIDAFKGSGNTYTRRNECLISVFDKHGRIWEGSFLDLAAILFGE